MGRWTPLILMAGGLAILLGTLLGINFPMGQQTASNTPTGKKSQVLPANINVNSSAPSRNRSNNTATEDRTSVAQDELSTNEDTTSSTPENNNSTESRTSVAQNNAPSESFSSPDNTSDTSATDVQSTDTSTTNTNPNNEPIRALWQRSLVVSYKL